MISALLVTLLVPSASAYTELDGEILDVHFNESGTWNTSTADSGLRLTFGDTSYEVTYEGTPYQLAAVEYTIGDSEVLDYLISSGYYTSGSGDPDTNLTVVSDEDLSTGDMLVSRFTFTDDTLDIEQIEGFALSGSAMGVVYTLTNTGTEALSDLRLAFMFDPDQDYDAYAVYDTINTLSDADGDGTNDGVVAAGYYSGVAAAITACDPEITEVGIDTGWYYHYDADLGLTTTDATGDYGIAAIITAGAELAAGDSVTFALVVSGGETADDAVTAGTEGLGLCDICNVDGDIADATYCGGDDCDDSEASAYPGGTEVWYDGIDGDCAGDDDYDQDADGDESWEWGGTDCDDTDASIHVGADDAWYDGVDSDCDGRNDYDADQDGYDSADYGGDDCDDEDDKINPDVDEIWYDGVDQDCDDNDLDQDGDGHASADYGGDDCDDLDGSISPSADEIWYDGIDEDCDGADDNDQDGDGHGADVVGGDDCDDTDAGAFPGAPEISNDGVDQDCDGLDLTSGGDDSGDDSGDDGDDEDSGETKYQGGCSCSTTPSGSAAWVGLIAAGALVRRRRRN